MLVFNKFLFEIETVKRMRKSDEISKRAVGERSGGD